jgi:hypothetical protein
MIADFKAHMSFLMLVLYSVRLKAALSKITQDSDQWIKPQNSLYPSSSPLSMNSTISQMDVMPTAPPSSMFTSYGLKVATGFTSQCLYICILTCFSVFLTGPHSS